MTKISVTGSKKDLDEVIEKLHGMKVLDIEQYDGELGTGSPFEGSEDLSELLVDIRSLVSKLPDVENSVNKNLSIEELQQKTPKISTDIEKLEREREELDRQISSVRDQREFFQKIKGSGRRYDELKGTKTLSVFIGRLDKDRFRKEAPDNQYEIFEGEKASLLFYRKECEGFEKAIRNASIEEYSLVETELKGTAEEILRKLDNRKKQLRQKKKQKEQKLKELSENWKGTLENMEDFLTEKVEKSEAPIKFATTENTFIAQGWIPSEQYRKVEEALAEVTEGKIHVQREEGENPPVKHENNKLVQPFEDLTDLVSVPKYNELDPSFALLLTFPLFFGFMIGDAGYGLTSFLVFYGGMKMFPAAEDVFKSLMWCSVATFIFGLVFGDAFGYIIFGDSSVLAEVTGIALFSQIPIIYHRVDYLGEVFMMALAIGVVHVNFGYILGMYNEYVRHGVKEAILEKGSWMILQAGAAMWYFFGAMVGGPVVAISVLMLYLGEGVEGVVEIPSLLSNVLSYLRIFGVSVAAISLATVVNAIASPMFATGTAWGLVFGVLILMIGHTFNTFIKIMEGFLQGIRLHYVEMFNKFYEGGGKKYAPFGAKTR